MDCWFSVSTSLFIFEWMENCIWFSSSWQYIKEASRHWVFSRRGRNPSSPAEVSSHLRLGSNCWQNILSQGILTLQCVSLVGHRSLPLLFLEMFQDPSVPLSAPIRHAREQGSESHGLSRCLRQFRSFQVEGSTGRCSTSTWCSGTFRSRTVTFYAMGPNLADSLRTS